MNTSHRLPLLFADEHYVATHKPAGWLVHRTRIAHDDHGVVLQALRDQLGQRVYPVHRLDRATSGILVFALHADAARRLALAFTQRRVDKRYLALVRGWTAPNGMVDRPIVDEFKRAPLPAHSEYRRLATTELAQPVGRYPSARYSLLEISPRTGRRHQIRRHLSHLRHPVVGDVNYGDRHHNHFFRDQLGLGRLFLLARSLTFHHPYGGREVRISAAPEHDWQQVFALCGWQAVAEQQGFKAP